MRSAKTAALLLALAAAPAGAAHVELLSRVAPGRESATASSASFAAAISADGRYVAFRSSASDLVAGLTDRNGINSADLFVWDRTTGTSVLVSRRALVNKVYLWERATGRTTWIAGFFQGSQSVAISADGSVVAFDSREPEVVPGQVDTLGTLDVFVWDRITGTKNLVSGAAAAPITVFGRFGHDLSGDGRFVLFESHTENDAGGTFDLYLYDRIAGTTVLVTHAAGSPTAPAGTGVNTGTASLSADGRFAAFRSTAKNLVSGGESPPGTNVFVFDRETGAIELISRAAGTVPEAPSGNRSNDPVISADGLRVAFVSNRLDLVPGTAGQQTGVNLFVHNRVTRVTTLASHSFEDSSRMSDGQCGFHVLSADGTAVAFSCSSTDLVPNDFNRFAGPLSDAFAAVIP